MSALAAVLGAGCFRVSAPVFMSAHLGKNIFKNEVSLPFSISGLSHSLHLENLITVT